MLSSECLYLASIIHESILDMGGYYEVRGNEAVLLESGKRAPREDSAHLNLANIDRCLPKLRDSASALEKEYRGA